MATNNCVNTSAIGNLITQNYTGSTWSVTVGDGTNNFTTSTNAGEYTTIGSFTFFALSIVWTGKGSAVAGSNLRVSLPTTATGNNYGLMVGWLNNVNIANYPVCANIYAGHAYIELFNMPQTATNVQMLVSDVGATGQFILSGWYT